MRGSRWCDPACVADSCDLLTRSSRTPPSGPGPAARLFQFRLQLQPPQRVVPHPFERASDRSERTATCAVQPTLTIAAALDQSRVAERAQLQRDGAERDVGHRRMNVPCCTFLIPDQAKDLAPSR